MDPFFIFTFTNITRPMEKKLLLTKEQQQLLDHFTKDYHELLESGVYAILETGDEGSYTQFLNDEHFDTTEVGDTFVAEIEEGMDDEEIEEYTVKYASNQYLGLEEKAKYKGKYDDSSYPILIPKKMIFNFIQSSHLLMTEHIVQ